MTQEWLQSQPKNAFSLVKREVEAEMFCAYFHNQYSEMEVSQLRTKEK